MAVHGLEGPALNHGLADLSGTFLGDIYSGAGAAGGGSIRRGAMPCMTRGAGRGGADGQSHTAVAVENGRCVSPEGEWGWGGGGAASHLSRPL